MADKISKNIRMFFRLWALYARLDLLWALRDTRYCLAQIFSDIVSACAAVAGVLLLAVKFGGIGGMSSDEILFMLGYSTLIDGVIMFFFGSNNVGYISRVIGRGQLDHNLMQPVPISMQLLASGFMPVSGNSRLICGLGISIAALVRLHLNLSFSWLIFYLINIICSAAIILSSVYIVSCTAFYAPAAAEEISMDVNELYGAVKGYPLGGLSIRSGLFFCTLIPIGLTAWFPSAVLLGKNPPALPAALTIIVAAIFTAIAVILFKKGMNYYAKYGSNRYSGFGHR